MELCLRKFKVLLLHLVAIPRWKIPNSPKKMPNFQKFSRVRLRSRFSTEVARKPTEDVYIYIYSKLTKCCISYQSILKGWEWNLVWELSDELCNWKSNLLKNVTILWQYCVTDSLTVNQDVYHHCYVTCKMNGYTKYLVSVKWVEMVERS